MGSVRVPLSPKLRNFTKTDFNFKFALLLAIILLYVSLYSDTLTKVGLIKKKQTVLGFALNIAYMRTGRYARAGLSHKTFCFYDRTTRTIKALRFDGR